MKTKSKLKFNVVPQPPLFTLNGMEYYLVEFEANPGVTQATNREAKEAFDASGHIPAKIRDAAIFDRKEFKKYRKSVWITLYDCREEMNDRVGYFFGKQKRGMQGLGLASPTDGFGFYHMDHGGGPGKFPALCWRKVA